MQTTWQEPSFRSSAHQMASHIHFSDSHGVTELRWRRCGAFLSVFRSGGAIGFPQLHNRRLIEAILARATFSAPSGARGPRLFEYEPSRRRADGRRHQTDVPSSAASELPAWKARPPSKASSGPRRLGTSSRPARLAFPLCFFSCALQRRPGVYELVVLLPGSLEIPADLHGRTAYQDTWGDLSAHSFKVVPLDVACSCA